jgi:hypothetical protein
LVSINELADGDLKMLTKMREVVEREGGRRGEREKWEGGARERGRERERERDLTDSIQESARLVGVHHRANVEQPASDSERERARERA